MSELTQRLREVSEYPQGTGIEDISQLMREAADRLEYFEWVAGAVTRGEPFEYAAFRKKRAKADG